MKLTRNQLSLHAGLSPDHFDLQYIPLADGENYVNAVGEPVRYVYGRKDLVAWIFDPSRIRRWIPAKSRFSAVVRYKNGLVIWVRNYRDASRIAHAIDLIKAMRSAHKKKCSDSVTVPGESA